MTRLARLTRRTCPKAAFLTVLALTLNDAAAADLDLGKQIATQGASNGVVACSTCHGDQGQGNGPAGFPRIAGMNAEYLTGQLRLMRAGKRTNPTMAAMAVTLDEAQLQAVSAYYAALPIPATESAPPMGETLKRAQDLANYGDWTGRGIPSCSQCHGPDGNGIGPHFPPLAGQHASYLTAQFEAWKSGGRSGDPLNLMASIVARIAPEDVTALAAYYAAMPAGPATPVDQPAKARALSGDETAGPTYQGQVPQQGDPEIGRAPGAGGYFQSPARDSLGDDPMDQTIARGEAIFQGTNTHPSSAAYVGNAQACGNCHLDAGRLADSAPLWAAWVSYPAYRSKNKRVNTYIERIQGCFEYSMNAQASKAGGPPAADSDPIVSLVAYSYWLASGAPTGDRNLPGRGFGRVEEPADGYDVKRGEAVFGQKCALCHGDRGQGVLDKAGNTLFPALWGPASYNWGAGMHKLDAAAAFIKHNMPLALPNTLSDQEAWDLSAFMNSHERPQDPRFKGDLAETAKEFHDSKYSLYGKAGLDGQPLGSHPAGP